MDLEEEERERKKQSQSVLLKVSFVSALAELKARPSILAPSTPTIPASKS